MGILKGWAKDLIKGKGHATIDVFKQKSGVGRETTSTPI